MTRRVLPEIERRMSADFPDKLREWQAAAEARAAKQETWKQNVRKAQKDGYPPPLPPEGLDEAELLSPVLHSSDVTVERCAALLSGAAPKGLLITRDEMLGWLVGMNAYNDAGRPFWIEAYGGRPYRVDRQKLKRPIDIPHLVVAAMGGTQPDKLAVMFTDADDGLLSRVCWFWPEPVPFRLGREPPNASQAIESLDRLRLLDMTQTEHGLQPICVPLANDALQDMESFGRLMQEQKADAAGLMRSAIGKFRGTALRVALVPEYLWWSVRPGYEAPPAGISRSAFQAAIILVGDYLLPMAERVYGDAGLPAAERNATSIARWIVKMRAHEVHVRHLQREVRLPGLRTAEAIREACNLLIEADWLRPPRLGIGPNRKVAYGVNPALWSGES
jgi:Protein of unknown function (DUF3987)